MSTVRRLVAARPGGDDVAQSQYLGSAEVFRPPRRAGFDEADQAVGEVACVE
jgi:hypothetical protein